MWLTFWRRNSASVSLLLFSKWRAHVSVAEIMSINGILLVPGTKFGPKFMVILSECYLQKIEHISIIQALNLNLAPKTFKRFVDDSHARFNNR